MSEWVVRVADAILAAADKRIHTAALSHDEALVLARAAIEALRHPPEAVLEAAVREAHASAEFDVSRVSVHNMLEEMIDAALSEEKAPA